MRHPGEYGDGVPVYDTMGCAGKCAVLVIDMLNFFSEEGDVAYQTRFQQAADAIYSLRVMADLAAVPVIYVNTEFGSIDHFSSSAMARKSEPHWIKGSAEANIISSLAPRQQDYIIPKTVNSGFFGTELGELLVKLEVARVLITGVHTHVCVALTAADAFYRNFEVVVLEECVTTIDLDRHTRGLEFIQRHLGRVGRLSEGAGLFT